MNNTVKFKNKLRTYTGSNRRKIKISSSCTSCYHLKFVRRNAFHPYFNSGGRNSAILNYFTEGNEPKLIVANEKAGTLILGKQGSVNVAHSHLFGTRWESKVWFQFLLAEANEFIF